MDLSCAPSPSTRRCCERLWCQPLRLWVASCLTCGGEGELNGVTSPGPRGAPIIVSAPLGAAADFAARDVQLGQPTLVQGGSWGGALLARLLGTGAGLRVSLRGT